MPFVLAKLGKGQMGRRIIGSPTASYPHPLPGCPAILRIRFWRAKEAAGQRRVGKTPFHAQCITHPCLQTFANNYVLRVCLQVNCKLMLFLSPNKIFFKEANYVLEVPVILICPVKRERIRKKCTNKTSRVQVFNY